MTNKNALLLLTTETPLHAGAGQSVAGIDLPIQREVHNGFPCVYGSSVKGALRAHAFHQNFDAQDTIDLFGPDHSDVSGGAESSHAGALLVGDARVLLMPVRSLQTSFKWVTCPGVLRRFFRDAARLQQPFLAEITLPTFDLDATQALGNTKSGQSDLFLEEFRFTQTTDVFIDKLAKQLASLSHGSLTEEELSQRLVIVTDDVFSFIAKNATSVNAHIAIDAESKTVKNGALWYEESLPPESVLYLPLTATRARRAKSELNNADAVLERFATLFPAGGNWLQIGGNETTGMGWCRVGINVGNA